MNKNIFKFNAIRNEASGEYLELIDTAESLMTKALVREYGQEEVTKRFSGQGIFERVLPDYKDASIDYLNNKLSADLFATSFKKYRPDVKLSFHKDTFLPADLQTAEFMKSRSVWSDPVFLSHFAVAYETAISPAAQSIAVGFYDDFVQVKHVGWGDSYAVPVESNDIFVVNEIGQDTFKVARQRLLNKTYTATPRPYGAEVSVNFYHLASGKVNWSAHILGIAKAYVKKWNLLSINSLKATIDEAMSAGSGNTPYFRATLNDENHFGLVSLLEAANDNGNINVYGDILAVSKLVPETGSDKQATEWGERGFVARYKGTDVYKLKQTLIPGTINTEPIFGAPQNYLWYINEAVAPIHLVFEGETLTVDRKSFETGDGTITFKVLSNFDMIYVASTKIGAIVIN